MSELASDLGIELLVKMARRGDVDPWDVDLIDVTDRYLDAIASLDVTDLLASAKLIFYASVLLHLKAQVLARGTADLSILDDPDELDDLSLLGLEDGADGQGRRRWQRRLVGPAGSLPLTLRPRLPRKRGVTLYDLVSALRSFEERIQADIEPGDPDEGFVDFDPELDIPSVCLDSGAKPEDPEAESAALRGVLGLPSSVGDIFDFERLSEELVPRGFSRSSVYLSLLFLAAQGWITLDQDRPFDSALEVTVTEPEEEQLAIGAVEESTAELIGAASGEVVAS